MFSYEIQKILIKTSLVWTNDVRNLMLWNYIPMSLLGPCSLICESYEVTEMKGGRRLSASSGRELRSSGSLRSE